MFNINVISLIINVQFIWNMNCSVTVCNSTQSIYYILEHVWSHTFPFEMIKHNDLVAEEN